MGRCGREQVPRLVDRPSRFADGVSRRSAENRRSSDRTISLVVQLDDRKLHRDASSVFGQARYR